MDYYRSGALRSLIPNEETPVKTMAEIVANISPPVNGRKINQGDTLSSIAAEYGVSVRELMRLNPDIKNPNMIKAGKELHVPGTSVGRSTQDDYYAGMEQDIQSALAPSRPGMEEGAVDGAYPEELLPLMKPLGMLGAAGLTKGIGAMARAAPGASRAGQFGNNVMRGVAQNARPSPSNVRPVEGLTGNPNAVKAMLAKMQGGSRPLGQGGQMPPSPQIPAFAGRGPAMPPGNGQALGQGARMPWMGKGTGTPPVNNSLLDALRQGSQKVSGHPQEALIQSLMSKARAEPTLNDLARAGSRPSMSEVPFQELLRQVGYR